MARVWSTRTTGSRVTSAPWPWLTDRWPTRKCRKTTTFWFTCHRRASIPGPSSGFRSNCRPSRIYKSLLWGEYTKIYRTHLWPLVDNSSQNIGSQERIKDNVSTGFCLSTEGGGAPCDQTPGPYPSLPRAILPSRTIPPQDHTPQDYTPLLQCRNPPPHVRLASGRYASYWNHCAHFLNRCLQISGHHGQPPNLTGIGIAQKKKPVVN